MNKVVLLMLILVCPGVLSAQEVRYEKENPVKKLEFMIGKWEGKGWSLTREGKKTTNVIETAEFKLDSSLVIVEGLGTKIDSVSGENVIVHQAFGILSFDPYKKTFTMRAYNNKGVSESEIEFIDDKIIQWKLQLPNGGMFRFTADFSMKDQWSEVGEFSRDGEKWTQTMSMKLFKVK